MMYNKLLLVNSVGRVFVSEFHWKPSRHVQIWWTAKKRKRKRTVESCQCWPTIVVGQMIGICISSVCTFFLNWTSAQFKAKYPQMKISHHNRSFYPHCLTHRQCNCHKQPQAWWPKGCGMNRNLWRDDCRETEQIHIETFTTGQLYNTTGKVLFWPVFFSVIQGKVSALFFTSCNIWCGAVTTFKADWILKLTLCCLYKKKLNFYIK